MIVENLKASCVDVVARELGRTLYAQRGVRGDGHWFKAIEESRPAAVEKINAMSNMELLDVIAEVLARE